MKQIFISSTFRDMQSERNAIQHRVLPEIRAFARKYGEYVDFIDLRWGVDTSDLQDSKIMGKVLDVCLDNIYKSRPFFVGLIGERYGTVAPEDDIKEAYKNIGFEGDTKDKSVTAVEIDYGALSSNYVESLFFFRNELDKKEMSPEQANEFAVERPEYIPLLTELKSEIRRRFPNRIHYYQAEWDPDLEGLTGLDGFVESLEAHLKELIVNEFGPLGELTPMETEEREAKYFMDESQRSFSARKDALEEIKTAVEDDSIQIITVSGEPGSGKSTLLSALAKKLKEAKHHVVLSFGGRSSMGQTVRDVIAQQAYYMEGMLQDKGIITDKRASDGFEATGDEQMDFIQLREYWGELLNKAVDVLGGPIAIIIDAVDQLRNDEFRGNSLFLPPEIPKGVTVVLSYPDDYETPMTGSPLGGVKGFSLSPLTKDEAKLVIDRVRGYKEMYGEVVEAILAKNDHMTPLYLSLLVSRLIFLDASDYNAIRRSGNDNEAIKRRLCEVVEESSETTEGICLDLLKDAGERINAELAKDVFLAIAASRRGLRRGDLEGLVKAKGHEWNSIDFALLEKYLAALLTYREDGRLDFSHRIVRKGIEQFFEADLERENGFIADYLYSLPDDDTVKVGEIFHHTRLADKSDYFFEYLERLGDDPGNIERLNIIGKEMGQYLETVGTDWLLTLNGRAEYENITYCYLLYSVLPHYFLETRENTIRYLVLLDHLMLRLESLDPSGTDEYIRLVKIYSNYRIGVTLFDMGLENRAAEYFDKALTGLNGYRKLGRNPRIDELYLDAYCGLLRGTSIPINQKRALCGDLAEALKGLLSETNDERLKREINRHLNDMYVYLKAQGLTSEAQRFLEVCVDSQREYLILKETVEDQISYATILNNLADSKFMNGDVEGALKIYGEALEVFERNVRNFNSVSSFQHAAFTYNNLGLVLLDVPGKLADALEAFTKAKDLREQVVEAKRTPRSKSYLANAWSNIALAKRRMGDNLGALEANRYVVEMRKSVFEDTQDDGMKAELASAYNNLAYVESLCGEDEAAEEDYIESMDLKEELAEKTQTPRAWKDLANTYNNLGHLESKMGDEESALTLFYKAYDINEALLQQSSDLEVMENMELCMINIGKSLISQCEVEEAVEILLEAEGLNLKLQSFKPIRSTEADYLTIEYCLAFCEYLAKDADGAQRRLSGIEERLLRFLSGAKTIQDLELLLRSYVLMAKVETGERGLEAADVAASLRRRLYTLTKEERYLKSDEF